MSGSARRWTSYKVRYMRCIYSHVLDGPHDWPSKHLPIVMVRGREINLEERDLYIGLFRYAHDPQRMLNFWMSAATEKVALVPRSPFIAAVDQIANHEDQWTRHVHERTGQCCCTTTLKASLPPHAPADHRAWRRASCS